MLLLGDELNVSWPLLPLWCESIQFIIRYQWSMTWPGLTCRINVSLEGVKGSGCPFSRTGQAYRHLLCLSSSGRIKAKQARIHTQGNNGERSHLKKPIVSTAFPRAFHPSPWSNEIRQSGISSSLVGDQVTWESQGLPSFSVSQLSPEAKLQLPTSACYTWDCTGCMCP